MAALHDPFNAFLDHSSEAVSHASEGPLSGLTLAVKDIFDIAGHRTGGGNPNKLAEAATARATAPSIQKLLDAGARFVGRTQTDELTFSLMGQNAHYPFPINPAAPDRVTGGSSSGSAAAVAGGLADIAIGSDTGGSIRLPASFCGLIGLRITHGSISLQGAMPLAPSLDTFGWFARDIEAYEKVGQIFCGEAVEGPAPRAIRLDALDGLLLGDAETSEYRRIYEIVAAVIGAAETAAPLTHGVDDLYWSFRKLQAREAWQVHGQWLSSADRRLGPGVKERFEFGSTLDVDDLEAQAATRASFRDELGNMLGNDGILVMPTAPGAAPKLDESFDNLQAYRERALRLLCLSGLSGFPQITLPLGTVDGAPFGISLLGPAGSDMRLIGLAKTILQSTRKS